MLLTVCQHCYFLCHPVLLPFCFVLPFGSYFHSVKPACLFSLAYMFSWQFAEQPAWMVENRYTLRHLLCRALAVVCQAWMWMSRCASYMSFWIISCLCSAWLGIFHTLYCLNAVRTNATSCASPFISYVLKSMFRVLFITRNSSGDEIVNVNFLYDNIVHTLQNTIDSCINSTTDRRGYVLKHRFPKFSEITQCNGHYAFQGHSRSPILVPIESSYTTSY